MEEYSNMSTAQTFVTLFIRTLLLFKLFEGIPLRVFSFFTRKASKEEVL